MIVGYDRTFKVFFESNTWTASQVGLPRLSASQGSQYQGVFELLYYYLFLWKLVPVKFFHLQPPLKKKKPAREMG